MNPKHHTSRIFIGLLIIAMLLTYLALALTTQYVQELSTRALTPLLVSKPKIQAPEPVKILDTSTWITYTDKNYPVSFKYPKGWTVRSTPLDKNGFYDITVVPTDQTPNFHITVSKNGFLGFEGLDQTDYKQGNLTGKSINNTLIGIKTGEYYYTFDGSLNAKKIAEFTTLMSTVTFQ